MRVNDRVYLQLDPSQRGSVLQLHYNKSRSRLCSVRVKWDSGHDPELDGWCFAPTEISVLSN